jgi:alkanesulfonate monooxygenase SsuD/methylene tetrahydromethanopterin reductase-like flavin-dependent oxidoreductase (luciferase family)
MDPPRLVLILSENWTLVDPRDLPGLVTIAVEAEAAGFDAVMVSEHVVLGRDADEAGVPANPRDYALPETRIRGRRGRARCSCSPRSRRRRSGSGSSLAR